MPFQIERKTLCYCTLNRDRRIQYFSLHSPTLKKDSRKGLIPNLTFESNFSYCWYKPSDHMLLQMPTCPVWMRLCAEQKENSPTFNRSRVLCGTYRNNMHDCSPQIMHLMSSPFCLLFRIEAAIPRQVSVNPELLTPEPTLAGSGISLHLFPLPVFPVQPSINKWAISTLITEALKIGRWTH